MRKILLFCFLGFLHVDGFAISAYPYKVAQTMNGKVVYIRMYGDEHCKRTESEDGYTIVRNDQGQWCYAQLDADSVLTATKWTLDHSHLPETQKYLKSVQKHLTSPSTLPKKEQAIPVKLKPAIGKRRMLIILMGFRDLSFIKSQADFDHLFNDEGYSEDGAQGSVRDFYLSASYRQLDLECDVYGPYSSERNMSYYGKNRNREGGSDVNPYGLFEEAINAVARDTNLQQYDGDGDGFIDNVHIIFAGHGEEVTGVTADAIWSHELTFARPYEIQGVKIDRYSCAPELRGNAGNGISRIGPHCHEIGHALGAMDYYDTNSATGGDYEGTGNWDVMASGSWNNDGITPADFNPYVKAYNFGWISPQVLPDGEVTLRPSNSDAESYYLMKADEYSDYYLLENRSKELWGAGLPGDGLLIYHIHYDIGNAANEINVSSPQMCYVVCASANSKQPGTRPASYGDINSSGCPYPGRTGNTDFGQSSTPKAFFWDGSECGIEINGISLDSKGNITLTNNSAGAAYKPKDRESLFFEGFEDLTSPVATSIKRTAWGIEYNSENNVTFTKRPNAYEGVRSLQLSALKSDSELSAALEFHCNPTTNGNIRLKIWVNSMHLRFNTPNIVRVGYLTANTTDWHFTEIASKDNDHWRQSFVELPDNAEPIFRIEGTAYAGSILAIDNIEVEQETGQEETGISPMSPPYSPISSIYSITGQKRTSMGPGLNIISNGTRTKVIIR